MIVSVTTLGAADGNAAGAAGKVVEYLDGRGAARGGANPGQMPELPRPDGTSGVVGYYADSVEGPGRWLGRGMSGMRMAGEVDPDDLRHVLLGQHARTGTQLLAATGSAARAAHNRDTDAPPPPRGDPDDELTLSQAAALLGVSPRYLRRVATRTAAVRAQDGDPSTSGSPYLDAAQHGDESRWRVSRAEVERFRAERKPPAAVVGYDLTFSVPKSVSILWAVAPPDRQAEIVAAVHDAVAAGMSYLEENAAFVRARGHRQGATGIVAASYLHATSRALDPQLHCHVVVANMAERADGAIRALDGRPLYAHAKTAGYLAAAELRHQLARRLGWAWEQPARGVADVAGVSEEAIRAMSRRAGEIAELTEALGVDSALARQVAAYSTRAAKEHGVDPSALRPTWAARLAGAGFDEAAADACYERQAAPSLVTAVQRERLFAHLGSARGVTEMSSTFDRRDVIQHVAEWAGDRLPASEITDLADAWLAHDVVVTVEDGPRLGRTADVIRRRDGRVVSAVGAERLCTTRGVLETEARISAAYVRGQGADAGVVPPAAIERAISQHPALGDDQRHVVRAICGSGQRIQCVLGPAGSGKTTALEVAARAWEAAGYQPVGAAVQGTAAEVLGAATGMPSETVASLLLRLDEGLSAVGPRSVVVVDEASTLGNRDLARLAAHVEGRGAALRLVGDPAQHSAVAAGGAWRRLVQDHPADTPELVEMRRQSGPDMAEVRLALADYREGRVTEALDRLRRDERVVEADTAEELLDAVVADWYVDRQLRRADPSRAASSMMADHHDERRELNRRARTMLQADGTLHGPALDVVGVQFQVGDEVVARHTDRRLRATEGHGRAHVRNGERGRVVEVRTATPGPGASLVVDFARRGPVVVPHAYLSRRLRPGVVGGLAHSYALTTNAAQGETYDAGRHLTTDRSSRPGVYVGLSRGRQDARLYTVRKRELEAATEEHPAMPRLEESTSTLVAITAHLRSQQAERLASEADPDAADVARLRRAYSVAELEAISASDGGRDGALARRALADEQAAVAAAARLHPEPALVARLGPRPATGPERETWDAAVGAVAIYRHRWGAVADSDGPGASWALGPPPGGGATEQYADASARLAHAEAVAAGAVPLADLVSERRTLVDALAGVGDDEAHAQLLAARQCLTERTAERDRRHERVEGMTAAPRRAPNREGIELARRDLWASKVAVAVAEHAVQLAGDRHAAGGGGGAARARVRARLAIVDAAIDIHARRAIDEPAPHHRALVGERPAHPELRRRWDDAVGAVERYRLVHQPAISEDGAPEVDGDPLVAAIGARPPAGSAAIGAYDAARGAVAGAQEAMVLARLSTAAPIPSAPSRPEVNALVRKPLSELRPQLTADRRAAEGWRMLEGQHAEAVEQLDRVQASRDAVHGEVDAPARRGRRGSGAASFDLAQAEADLRRARAQVRVAAAELAAAQAIDPDHLQALEEAVGIREERVAEQALLRPPRWLRRDLRQRVWADSSLFGRADAERLAGAYGAVAVFVDQAGRSSRAAQIDDVLGGRPDEADLARVWDATHDRLHRAATAAPALEVAQLGL